MTMAVDEYPPDYYLCGVRGCPKLGDHVCWWFHGHKRTTDRDYLVCFECGHVYRTRLALVVGLWRKVRIMRRPNRILACPMCAHDW